MAEVIFDNPATMCREVRENFSNLATESTTVILAVPKSAIDLKMSVFWKPWGTYSEALNMSKRVHSKNPKAGVRRTPEETAVLLKLYEGWLENKKLDKPLSFQQFWEANVVTVLPEITKGAFTTFCTRENMRRVEGTTSI